jgi:DinB family protein
MDESMSGKTNLRKLPAVITAMMLTTSVFVLAQAHKPVQQRTIGEALDSWITETEDHLVPLAEAMPEDKYSFAPPVTYGEFKGVRTFGQQVKHLAANNYWQVARILGETPDLEMTKETGPDSVQTKPEILAYLKGSFQALHKAMATINEKNVVEPITTSSSWQRTRLSAAEDAVAHSFNHYGQLVEYLRMNGIIPPDSR